MQHSPTASPPLHSLARVATRSLLLTLLLAFVAWPTLAGDHAPATAETISDGEEMRVRATLKAA
jgi:hypothetical protein